MLGDILSMEDYSAYIPKGELELPPAPTDHYWEVKNVIHSTEGITHYYIEIRLYNKDNNVVITVIEEWDVKKETFSDFAISTAGLTLIALTAYQSFKSINWGRDNDNLVARASGHGDDKSYDIWVSKTLDTENKE
jgi:hypothetical protein